MSLTVERLRDLRRAALSRERGAWEAAVEALGAPTTEQLADEALPFLDSPDRNVRVAALRVLARADGPAAVEGVLRGLDDPMKRVREVAAKSSPRFVHDQRVVSRLKVAVERDESGSCVPAAYVLAGVYSSPYGIVSLEPVADVLQWLMEVPKHRQSALFALLKARVLTDEVAALLRDVVASGTKQEAVSATRRLCGFRVAHDAELDDETRRRSDRAWGDVFYWVRVPEER